MGRVEEKKVLYQDVKPQKPGVALLSERKEGQKVWDGIYRAGASFCFQHFQLVGSVEPQLGRFQWQVGSAGWRRSWS